MLLFKNSVPVADEVGRKEVLESACVSLGKVGICVLKPIGRDSNETIGMMESSTGNGVLFKFHRSHLTLELDSGIGWLVKLKGDIRSLDLRLG